MTDLGIPGVRQGCTHDTPTFGCASCIRQQRESWAHEKFNEWKKTYAVPKCKDCGGAMTPYDYEIISDTLMEATVICGGFDADGSPTCSDLVVGIKIS